jgi:hypothetical protein
MTTTTGDRRHVHLRPPRPLIFTTISIVSSAAALAAVALVALAFIANLVRSFI